MKVPIPCPECGRITSLAEEYLGRRFQCPGCGAAVSSKKADPVVEPYAPPRAKIGPVSAAELREGAEPGRTWHFHVQVKRDPERRLKGILKAELTPRGLILRKPKGEEIVARLPIGTPARLESGPIFQVYHEDREITLVIAQRGV